MSGGIIVPSEITEKFKQQAKELTPDMVDKFGTKWYRDPAGTQYAQAYDRYGVSLGHSAGVWLIEELNGTFKMCLVIDSAVVFEGFAVQQIGHEIDRLRALKKAGRRF